jgi:hypothetical protein
MGLQCAGPGEIFLYQYHSSNINPVTFQFPVQTDGMSDGMSDGWTRDSDEWKLVFGTLLLSCS